MDKISITIGTDVFAGLLTVLIIILFFLLISKTEALKKRRLYDAKFFIKSCLEEVIQVALLSIKGNTMHFNIGVWDARLQYLLEKSSIKELFVETKKLKKEIQVVADQKGNEEVGRVLTGFELIFLDFEELFRKRKAIDYNKGLNELMREFLEWRDAIKEIERIIQKEKMIKRPKISIIMKDIGKKGVSKKTAQK